MRIALINPNWSFEGSIYFGCREPHLPMELGIAAMQLRSHGHQVELIDAHMLDLSLDDIALAVGDTRAEMAVVTTAPTYLFWRCAPPELRVPQELCRKLRDRVPMLVAIGPHGSTTPRPVLAKLGVDVVVMGECEDALIQLAARELEVTGTCFASDGDVRIVGSPRATTFKDLGPVHWPSELVARHKHHHHRFDRDPVGPGAEVEASRGCPYSCTFCAKLDFRNAYRRRSVDAVLAEVDALTHQGATYIYFIDEIFLPNVELLEGLVRRPVAFGVQTRIDLWKPDLLELLGRAGCVSIEAGIESLSAEGRDLLAKRCRLDTEALARLLIEARRHVPFVQANLIETTDDDEAEVERWRRRMREAGVWANDPVPLFPYPGSPDYRRLWGAPDDQAWERAVDHYISRFSQFSDIQDDRPVRLDALELEAAR